MKSIVQKKKVDLDTNLSKKILKTEKCKINNGRNILL